MITVIKLQKKKLTFELDSCRWGEGQCDWFLSEMIEAYGNLALNQTVHCAQGFYLEPSLFEEKKTEYKEVMKRPKTKKDVDDQSSKKQLQSMIYEKNGAKSSWNKSHPGGNVPDLNESLGWSKVFTTLSHNPRKAGPNIVDFMIDGGIKRLTWAAYKDFFYEKSLEYQRHINDNEKNGNVKKFVENWLDLLNHNYFWALSPGFFNDTSLLKKLRNKRANNKFSFDLISIMNLGEETSSKILAFLISKARVGRPKHFSYEDNKTTKQALGDTLMIDQGGFYQDRIERSERYFWAQGSESNLKQKKENLYQQDIEATVHLRGQLIDYLSQKKSHRSDEKQWNQQKSHLHTLSIENLIRQVNLVTLVQMQQIELLGNMIRYVNHVGATPDEFIWDEKSADAFSVKRARPLVNFLGVMPKKIDESNNRHQIINSRAPSFFCSEPVFHVGQCSAVFIDHAYPEPHWVTVIKQGNELNSNNLVQQYSNSPGGLQIKEAPSIRSWILRDNHVFLGMTPLMLAAGNGSLITFVQIVKILDDAGVLLKHLKLKDGDGRTALVWLEHCFGVLGPALISIRADYDQIEWSWPKAMSMLPGNETIDFKKRPIATKVWVIGKALAVKNIKNSHTNQSLSAFQALFLADHQWQNNAENKLGADWKLIDQNNKANLSFVDLLSLGITMQNLFFSSNLRREDVEALTPWIHKIFLNHSNYAVKLMAPIVPVTPNSENDYDRLFDQAKHIEQLFDINEAKSLAMAKWRSLCIVLSSLFACCNEGNSPDWLSGCVEKKISHTDDISTHLLWMFCPLASLSENFINNAKMLSNLVAVYNHGLDALKKRLVITGNGPIKGQLKGLLTLVRTGVEQLCHRVTEKSISLKQEKSPPSGGNFFSLNKKTNPNVLTFKNSGPVLESILLLQEKLTNIEVYMNASETDATLTNNVQSIVASMS